MKEGQTVRFMHSGSDYKIEETGIFRLRLERKPEGLHSGDVGYLIAGIKTISDVRVGDTVTLAENPAPAPLKGFKEVKPVVFSSIYPVDASDYEELLSAIEKLKLNDASLVYEKDSSAALGFGFRCGFLGLLHLEVVQERIEREFGLSIIFTSPSVEYRVTMRNGEVKMIDNPVDYPNPAHIEKTEEPYIRATIITPAEYVGAVINLCLEKRGYQESMTYLDEKRVEMVYNMPLAEVLFEFYDRLKSISRGYASFDYEVTDFQPTELVKLDILLNGNPVDALSQLIYKANAAYKGRIICKKLKEEIPRHQFPIPIQGAIGSTIVSRETISAVRKDRRRHQPQAEAFRETKRRQKADEDDR